MAAIGSLASAPAALAPQREARTRAAIGILVGFLALEPLVRAVIWWLAADGVRQSLHADARLLAVVVIATAGAAMLSDVRAQVSRHKWLLWLAAAWALAATVSSAMAVNPGMAATHSLWWAIYLVFGIWLLAMLRAHPNAGQIALLGWCIGFCGYAVVVTAFVAVDPMRSDVELVWQMPGVRNIRHLGFEAAAAALIGSVWRPNNLKVPSLWLLRLTAVVGWAIMFWSGGRGHLVACIAALVCIFAVSGIGDRNRHLLRCSVLAALGFAVATLHAPPFGSLGAWRTIGFTSHNAVATGSGDLTSGRIDMWLETLSLIRANLIFGVGEAQGLLLLKTAGGVFVQPHNMILQAGMAWGIVGGSAFLAAIGFVLLRAARRLRGGSMASPAAAGYAVALAMVANSMLDASMFHPRPIIMFMIGVCIALSGATARTPLRARAGGAG